MPAFLFDPHIRGLMTRAAPALACTLTLAVQPAFAQVAEAAPPDVATVNAAVYDPAYFARYNPSTAEDILDVIPGVPAILEESSRNRQERGFGSGGTRVLLDGRRFPGKANDLSANLRRIPANAVARVELISGTTEGVSVQSDGIMVNIILKEGVSVAGTGAWEAYVRFNDEGRVETDGLISYNGSLGGMSYTLGIEKNVWSPPTLASVRWSDRFRDERYFYPGGELKELRPQYWGREHDKWIYTGSLDYEFNRAGRVQLNGFYQTMDILQIDQTAFTRYDTSGAVILEATDYHLRDSGVRTTLEVGGEYAGSWWGGDFHALAIMRRDDSPTLDYRNQITGGVTSERNRSQSAVATGEDIFRLSYTREISDNQSIEVGAEGARNTLEQDLRVFFDRNNDNLVEEIPIPTAHAEVWEDRAEGYVTHRWTPFGAASLESSLTYETSKIANNYPFSPERKLSFWKPRIEARYRLSPASQIRFLAERSVSQLDFTLFVPRFDFVDNEIDAGNPAIEPEKTWTYELGLEYRLPSDGGLLEGRIFYETIEDPIDKVPLPDGRGGYYSAEGNLSDATRQGAEVKASVRLTPIRLPDALLSFRYTWQDSEVADPFTGETRRLKDDFGDNYEVSFRHDVTAFGLSYGLTYKYTGSHAVFSDLMVRELFRVGPVMSGFLEKQLGGAMALRFEVQNLGGAREAKTRHLYAVSAMDGALRQIEHWDEYRDVRFALGLRGKF